MPRCGLLVYIFIMIILNCLWIISVNNIRCMSWSWWCHYVAYWYKIYDDIVWWLYMMMRCHENTMMLRSTMGPYWRTCVEIAYGKTMIHSTETVLRDISLGRVVGMSPWCITAWLTYLSQHQCGLHIYIFWFSTYQNPCICFSKSICSMKQH